MNADILIVGAGIAGLTAALAIHQTGRNVGVIERAPQLAELGAGLQLAANGSRVLIQLGLEDALAPLASEAEGKTIRLWSTGQSWTLFDLGQESRAIYGAPYWTIHRGDLHRELLNAARKAGIAVQTGTTALGYRNTADGICLLTDQGEISAAAIIGADGIHSLLRDQMVGKDQARFTGIMAWRGIADMARLPAHLRRNVAVNWIGPGRHVITYPLRGGALMNFVGVVESDDWRSESWMDRGSKEECLADFDGWHEDVQAIINGIDEHFRWALLERAPLASCADGRAILIGDSCHATLPFLAQGANMAIEDAMVVARCLNHYAGVNDAFTACETMRLERTGAIVKSSSDQARRFHNPDYAQAQTAAAIIDREWEPQKVHERYDWLFRYDAITAPFPGMDGLSRTGATAQEPPSWPR